MTFVKHWGVWVDSEKPVTGVLSHNQIAWEWIGDEGHCLTCAEIEKEIQEECTSDDGTVDWEEYESEADGIMCEGDHERLLGDWKQDEEYKWYPNPEGEWAAIQRESTVQVAFSKTTTRGALCSPCYPGQVDLGSEGEFLAYTLPGELLRGNDEQDYADTVNKPIFPEEV